MKAWATIIIILIIFLWIAFANLCFPDDIWPFSLIITGMLGYHGRALRDELQAWMER